MRSGIPSLSRALAGLAKTAGAVAVGAAILLQAAPSAEAAGRHSALIVDANTGKVLYSDDADEARYPASLTKMMTLYMLFEAMEQDRVSLTTQMKVSSYAAARPPTKLRLKVGSTLSVQEAILGLVTLSANDASVVIAEHLGGTEARFAQMMTAKARQLGMSRTTFRNANGLPNVQQRTTARDMATLGIALREHFPRQYKYFATKSFNFRGRTIGSHNRLVGRIKGVDGIKTGYINASGFNLVSSLYDGERKIVGVVFGGNTAAARDNEMAKLLNKYLPQASRSSAGPLVAVAKPNARGSRVLPEVAAEEVAHVLPARGPIPSPSKRGQMSIDQRIAQAYGSSAGDAIARMSHDAPRDVVGRDALRQALVAPMPEPARRMVMPAAETRAPAGFSARPVPRGEIPGGADLDPETTGTVTAAAMPAASAAPRSPWVIQIAASPDRSQAMEMLANAKSKGGSALAKAVPYTEPVGGQSLHRARFAGFQSKAEANGACAALKKRSFSCFAIAN